MGVSFAIGAGLTAYFLSCIGLFFGVPILRKLRAGQNVLSHVKEHKSKGGTPTMGGLIFVCAAIISTLIFSKELSRELVVAVVVGCSYAIIGFFDDLIKIKEKQNLGLTPSQKTFFQLAVALLVSLYVYANGLTKIKIPYFNSTIDFGFWVIPLGIFTFLATVNCVNLTDGLDGLAAGSCIPFFAFFGVVIAVGGEELELATLAFSLVGALFGFLRFNSYPASVFMGDVGSLSLGGFAACIAMISGNLFYIATVGVVFVLSGASVILQVFYFKLTKGERIFKMTPIHHHFQQCGYSESKIAYSYFSVTAVAAAFNFLFII